MIEETGVFTRGVGTQTDIVEKEMYTFKTKGGEQVSLRPEGTAPIMRSFIEHSLYTKPQPVKFYYLQPFFVTKDNKQEDIVSFGSLALRQLARIVRLLMLR